MDARHFTAVAYRGGKAAARCRIWFGGSRSFGGGIAFSFDESGGDNSFNESMSVTVGERSLTLKPLGMAARSYGGGDGHLSVEGGAELYWSMFVEPLQR